MGSKLLAGKGWRPPIDTDLALILSLVLACAVALAIGVGVIIEIEAENAHPPGFIWKGPYHVDTVARLCFYREEYGDSAITVDCDALALRPEWSNEL